MAIMAIEIVDLTIKNSDVQTALQDLAIPSPPHLLQWIWASHMPPPVDPPPPVSSSRCAPKPEMKEWYRTWGKGVTYAIIYNKYMVYTLNILYNIMYMYIYIRISQFHGVFSQSNEHI